MATRRLLNSGLRAHGPRRYNRQEANARPADAPPAPTPAPARQTSEQDVSVPEGMTKAKDLEQWVGQDVARARAVLAVEQDKPEKDRRKTLVSALEDLIQQNDVI